MQQLSMEQNNKLLYGDLSMSFDQWVKKLHNNYIYNGSIQARASTNFIAWLRKYL